MDLHDFNGQAMYFDEPTPVTVQHLLARAAAAYGNKKAELYLQQAYARAPQNPTVLVAMYRFYYYQHRLEEAIDIANQVMRLLAQQLDFPARWEELTFAEFSNGLLVSFTKVRFYLLALKGTAYLHLRLGKTSTGITMLNKIIQMDAYDRLGARALLEAVGPMPVDNISQTAVG